MLLSKACVYGLRASLYLAYKKEEGFISIKEIAEELDISFHFLTKILQQLSAAGFMESYKGPNGGIRLTNEGVESKLFDLVTVIDGPELFTECVLGLPGCGSSEPCALHDNWMVTREGIQNMLESMTLIDLAAKRRKSGLGANISSDLS